MVGAEEISANVPIVAVFQNYMVFSHEKNNIKGNEGFSWWSIIVQ